MIYILISYLIMSLWLLKWWLIDLEDGLGCFKVWVFSPVALPWILFIKFLNWGR